jgi:hypothetical protein
MTFPFPIIGGPLTYAYSLLTDIGSATTYPSNVQSGDFAIVMQIVEQTLEAPSIPPIPTAPSGSTEIAIATILTTGTALVGSGDNQTSVNTNIRNTARASFVPLSSANAGGLIGGAGTRRTLIFRSDPSGAAISYANIGTAETGTSFSQNIPYGSEQPPLFAGMVTCFVRTSVPTRHLYDGVIPPTSIQLGRFSTDKGGNINGTFEMVMFSASIRNEVTANINVTTETTTSGGVRIHRPFVVRAS